MFESLVISTARKSAKSSRSWWVSLLIHSAVLLLLVVTPLLHYSKLPVLEPLTYLAAAPLPLAPTPPTPPVQPARPVAPPRMQDGAPVVVLHDPRVPDVVPEAPPDVIPDFSNWKDTAAGVGVPLPGIQLERLQGVSGGISEVPSAAVPPPPPVEQRMPIRVGGTIQQAKKIRHVQPIYPELARRARVEGVVLLEAQIDELGNVRDLRLLRGHPLLNGAAIEAVQQWKYQPTLLNGEPVPVMTMISLVFSLR